MHFLSKQNRSSKVLGRLGFWVFKCPGSSRVLGPLGSWVFKVLGPVVSSRVLDPCFQVCSVSWSLYREVMIIYLYALINYFSICVIDCVIMSHDYNTRTKKQEGNNTSVAIVNLETKLLDRFSSPNDEVINLRDVII